MSRLARRTFLRQSTALVLGPALSAFAGADRAEVTPIDERLRLGATNAPLAMQFRGTTAEEARRWQAGFADTLRMLLGPTRPPAVWDSVLERIVTLDDHVREERLLTADGLDPVPFHLLLPRHLSAGSHRPPARRAGDPRPRRLRPRRRSSAGATRPSSARRLPRRTTTTASSSSASATWWPLLA